MNVVFARLGWLNGSGWAGTIRTLDRSWSRGTFWLTTKRYNPKTAIFALTVVRTSNPTPMSWPPWSPGLNPTNFYLQHSMTNAVYTNNVDTTVHLWQRIHDAASDIRTAAGAIDCVPTSFRHRVDACAHSHGGHLEHLLPPVQQENSPSVKHFACLMFWNIVLLNILSSVTFYRSISEPVFIRPFRLVLRP
jgi:hypothetical protein